MVFLRERQKAPGGGFVHPNALWEPVSFPIEGTYNDYGALQGFDPQSFAVRSFVEWLEPRLVEYPEGPQDRREPLVTRAAASDLTEIQELIHAAPYRVRVDDSIGRSSRAIAHHYGGLQGHPEGDMLGYCLIREDVYQGLLTIGFPGWQHRVTLDTVLADTLAPVVEGLERLRTCDRGDRIGVIKAMSIATLEANRAAYDGDDGFIKDFRSNLFLQASLKHEGGVPLPDPTVLCRAIAEHTMISLHLGQLRKFWSPQCGAGSQDDGFESQAALHQITARVLQEMRADADTDT
jgi:hypothetical protein